MTPRPGFVFTLETAARLRVLAREGASAEAIARALGCGRDQVLYKARALGLKLARLAEKRPEFWTAERLAELPRLLVAGLTAAQIAARLGCTRNAVIAKVGRLGLAFAKDKRGQRRRLDENGRLIARPPQPVRALRPHAERLARDRTEAAERKARRVAGRGLPEPEPSGEVFEIVQGARCRFMHGSVPDDWKMCGAPTADALTRWCPHHAARVFAGAAADSADETSEVAA